MKQEFYNMPNGLTYKLHNKIRSNFSRCLGEMKKCFEKNFGKNISTATEQIAKRLFPGSGETDGRMDSETQSDAIIEDLFT